MPQLTRLTIELHGETEVLDILTQVVELNKLPDDGRIVKALTDLPRQTSLTEVALKVAGSEVKSQRDLVVIAMRKTLGDRATKATYFYDQMTLYTAWVSEIRYKEGFTILKDCCIR